MARTLASPRGDRASEDQRPDVVERVRPDGRREPSQREDAGEKESADGAEDEARGIPWIGELADVVPAREDERARHGPGDAEQEPRAAALHEAAKEPRAAAEEADAERD